MRFARIGERKDNRLDVVIEPLSMLSSDNLVICRAKADSDNPDGEIACLTVRDSFSGAVMTYPGKEKDAKEMIAAYNHFVGANTRRSNPEL